MSTVQEKLINMVLLVFLFFFFSSAVRASDLTSNTASSLGNVRAEKLEFIPPSLGEVQMCVVFRSQAKPYKSAEVFDIKVLGYKQQREILNKFEEKCVVSHQIGQIICGKA